MSDVRADSTRQHHKCHLVGGFRIDSILGGAEDSRKAEKSDDEVRRNGERLLRFLGAHQRSRGAVAVFDEASSERATTRSPSPFATCLHAPQPTTCLPPIASQLSSQVCHAPIEVDVKGGDIGGRGSVDDDDAETIPQTTIPQQLLRDIPLRLQRFFAERLLRQQLDAGWVKCEGAGKSDVCCSPQPSTTAATAAIEHPPPADALSLASEPAAAQRWPDEGDHFTASHSAPTRHQLPLPPPPHRIGHPYSSRVPAKHKKARTSFDKAQIAVLESRFLAQKYLASTDRAKLASQLCMHDGQVKTWFQNRRTKWRRQEAEEREVKQRAALRQLMQLHRQHHPADPDQSK